MQQPVSTFDQEQSDHWEELADMAYYQRLAMQEELDEDDIPIGWLTTKPSECQQTNTPELTSFPWLWFVEREEEQQINTPLQEDCT